MVWYIPSFLIPSFASRIRSAVFILKDSISSSVQPKRFKLCTVAPAFAARVALIFLTPCADL